MRQLVKSYISANQPSRSRAQELSYGLKSFQLQTTKWKLANFMALFFCLKDCLEEIDFDYFWFLISTNQKHCLPSCSISSTITKPLLTLNTLNNRCRVMDSTVSENSLNTCLLYNLRTSTYIHETAENCQNLSATIPIAWT